jgi:hypothetical protein
MADFTKSGAQVDEWAQITANDTREGAAISVPDDIGILVEVAVAHDSVNAHANGAQVIIEGSGETSGDEDWSEILSVRSDGGTAKQANVDVESTGTSLYIDLTTGFESRISKYFVKNNTIANSEIVRMKSFVTDDYLGLVDSMTNTQQTTADVFNIVNDWVFRIPKEFRRARVLVFNDDADCTICSRTRKALATDIE